MDCSTLAMIPFDGSKKSVMTLSQPPKSSIVNNWGGVGNWYLPVTPGTTGR